MRYLPADTVKLTIEGYGDDNIAAVGLKEVVRVLKNVEAVGGIRGVKIEGEMEMLTADKWLDDTLEEGMWIATK